MTMKLSQWEESMYKFQLKALNVCFSIYGFKGAYETHTQIIMIKKTVQFVNIIWLKLTSF